MSLKILNLRLGHANNSSSSHSILLLPEGTRAQDVIGSEPYDFGFGWNSFTLNTPQMKVAYLIANCFYMFERTFGEVYARMILRELFDMEDLGLDPADLVEKEWYVDHQSHISIPGEYSNPSVPNAAFLKDLTEWLKRDSVIIIGGNDNDGEQEPPVADTVPTLKPLHGDFGGRQVVARKDGTQGYWTLFNRQSGAKLRLSFEDPTPVAIKSTYPELVDLKITDRCPFKCVYCYQSSLPDGASWKKVHGEHSTMDYAYAHVFSDMQVFEVAIGGGEPTLDPQFMPWLERLAGFNISANFTTRSTHWLEDRTMLQRIAKNARSFAFSIDSLEELKRFGELWESTLEWSRGNAVVLPKASVQFVLGTFPIEDLPEFMMVASDYSLNVTLLGYKAVGFGADWAPHAYDGWIDVIAKLDNKRRPYLISIDTALAHQFEAQLLAAGLPKWTFHVEEGGHSCYVDAITMRMGPSSYDHPATMLPFGHPNELPKLFSLFPASVPVSYASHPHP